MVKPTIFNGSEGNKQDAREMPETTLGTGVLAGTRYAAAEDRRDALSYDDWMGSAPAPGALRGALASKIGDGEANGFQWKRTQQNKL
ncbi:MAG: hypothetical protein AB1813_23610, partial [Verrucomicrobiota bacterium]